MRFVEITTVDYCDYIDVAKVHFENWGGRTVGGGTTKADCLRV